MERPSTFRTFFLPALLMAGLGWGGLVALIFFTLPTVWPRWGFFALTIIALTGTALPILYFLHQRFPSQPAAGPRVLLRQAIWVGTYGAILAWLQLGRLVTLWVILGLAAGLMTIEYLIRLREKARWMPPVSDDHTSQPPLG
ncbi:MAG: hypothetical protein ACP5QU_05295 [Anaerolineae bacterium]